MIILQNDMEKYADVHFYDIKESSLCANLKLPLLEALERLRFIWVSRALFKPKV